MTHPCTIVPPFGKDISALIVPFYGQALIKKRGQYWPKGVPGNLIDKYFAGKEIGYAKTWQTEFKGKTKFTHHCLKEEKYVYKFMSNFRHPGCNNAKNLPWDSKWQCLVQIPGAVFVALKGKALS
jgi:hypothetical protein